MKNKVQLITYVDRLGCGDLNTLHSILQGPLKNLFGGIHLLPFFYPIDGADAGFDPIDHSAVDDRLGNWSHIKSLGAEYDVMADLIVNHISALSPQFSDYSAHGKNSEFNGLFLTFSSVFPNGATEEDVMQTYRPRPGLPFTYTTLKNGEKKMLWTTFTSNQLDIDVNHPKGQAYLQNILNTFGQAGVKIIRLDAAGYAIKKQGTSSFMIPETFDFIGELTEKARALGIEVLVEIHSYYKKQIEIAKKVDRVYDFALPPLILHALINRDPQYLKTWLAISPRNAITVLDTHDGIGVIDVGADPISQSAGLLPPEAIDKLVEQMHENTLHQSRKATGAAASNLDLYQVNSTYYDALGRDDNKYIIARAIQFFSPGVPQVYYVGLLAGENDMELLERTKVGRDINRHYYSLEEIESAVQKPVVTKLFELIRFRNSHNAFNGQFSQAQTSSKEYIMRWDISDEWAELHVDFETLAASIHYSSTNGKQSLSL